MICGEIRYKILNFNMLLFSVSHLDKMLASPNILCLDSTVPKRFYAPYTPILQNVKLLVRYCGCPHVNDKIEIHRDKKSSHMYHFPCPWACVGLVSMPEHLRAKIEPICKPCWLLMIIVLTRAERKYRFLYI